MNENSVLDRILSMSEEELEKARQEIRKNGLTIKTPFGDFVIINHQTFTSQNLGGKTSDQIVPEIGKTASILDGEAKEWMKLEDTPPFDYNEI